jgi:hypothetical protein
MAMDPVAILKDIGKQYGKRVSSVNLFDANVCTSPWDPECPWEILALPGDIFRHQLNITFEDHKVRFCANGDFIAATVTGNLDVGVCSINRRDKVFQLELSPFRVPGFQSFPVYSRQHDAELLQFLNSAALATALNTLQLTERESLHIYGNGILLYLQRDSRHEVMSAVEVACKLMGQMPAVDDSLDLTGLPAKFENLFELIPKWALSDDEKRSEMLEEESLESLRTFVKIVSPHIPAIDKYLDSFGDESPPEVAVTLGTLAECCLEAQIRLRNAKEE